MLTPRFRAFRRDDLRAIEISHLCDLKSVSLRLDCGAEPPPVRFEGRICLRKVQCALRGGIKFATRRIPARGHRHGLQHDPLPLVPRKRLEQGSPCEAIQFVWRCLDIVVSVRQHFKHQVQERRHVIGGQMLR